MNAAAPADLDLLALRLHVKAQHKDKGTRGEDGKPIKLPALARAHATWHSRARNSDDPHKQMPGVGHKHGGEIISVEITPNLYSIHPAGCFTGRDSIQE